MDEGFRKALFEERLEFDCPTCDRHSMLYERHVTRGQALALIALANTPPAANGFIHVPSTGHLARQGGAIAKMRYWRLLTEMPDARREDGTRSGWWAVAPRGWAFLQGFPIEYTALVFNEVCYGLGGKPWTISDALKEPFDLRVDKEVTMTLYEQLWTALDGAYARYRRLKANPEANGGGADLSYARGRATGLVEAIAVMSQGVMDADEVKRQCVERWKSHQPKAPDAPR